MKLSLKPVIAGVATLAVTGGGLVLGTTPAFAAAPSWEPDTFGRSRGAVVFYDTTGHVLTGGTNLSHLADFAAATSAGDSGATKATLLFAAPDHTQADPAGWSTAPGSASTTFPNAAAPNPVKGPGFTKPLVTVGAGGDLSAWLGGITPDSTAGYANIYQVRVVDSGAGGVTSDPQYWATDILVSGSTWSVVYPDLAVTATSLTLTPGTSPQPHATGIHLASAVSVSSGPTTFAGTLQFFDGTTSLAAATAVSNGSPAASLDITPADGSHSYKAVFTPTGGTAVTDSTSPVRAMTISAPTTPTHLALGVSPASAAQYAPVTFTANVTEDDAATTGYAGTVTYLEGATTLGTQSVNDGTPGEYKFTTTGLAQGSHTVHATFAPSNAGYAGSTSADVTVTVTSAACPGDPSGAACTKDDTVQVTVNPGSLTITTPYTSTNPFVLPDMVLNPTATLLVSAARFPKATDPQIVVQSTVAGDPNWTVFVSATDLQGVQPANKINGENLGLTGGVLAASPPGRTVAFTDTPAGSGVAVGATTGAGLKGSAHTFAHSTAGGNGSYSLYGTLTLQAPTTTHADTYTGTITFSVA